MKDARAAGYFDTGRSVTELWNDEVGTPVAAGCPGVEVDTAAVARQVVASALRP